MSKPTFSSSIASPASKATSPPALVTSPSRSCTPTSRSTPGPSPSPFLTPSATLTRTKRLPSSPPVTPVPNTPDRPLSTSTTVASAHLLSTNDDATSATRSATFAPIAPSSTPLSANRRQHLSSQIPASTNVLRFVFISLDILFQLSLADCFIDSDSFYDTDCPRVHRLSETLSFLDRHPYSLIMADQRYYSLVIVFPSSTLHVFQFSDLFLTRFRFHVPLTIKPLIDARSCFMMSF